MEWEDVMQECHCLFLKLERRYENEVTSAAWFMGLYKSSLRNLIIDLASDDSYLRQCTLECQLSADETECLSDRIGTEEHEGNLACLLEEAPEEVRAVVALILNAPPKVYAVASAAWEAQGRKKEHGNAFLCSMLGFDERVNVVQMTRDYFTGGSV